MAQKYTTHDYLANRCISFIWKWLVKLIDIIYRILHVQEKSDASVLVGVGLGFFNVFLVFRVFWFVLVCAVFFRVFSAFSVLQGFFISFISFSLFQVLQGFYFFIFLMWVSIEVHLFFLEMA